MRFHVPQFIEKESKLIGPLTLRQFLWFLGGGTVFIIAQFFLSGTTLLIATAFIAAGTASLAYLKIDDVPLPKYIGNAFIFLLSTKKYTYRGDENNKLPISNNK